MHTLCAIAWQFENEFRSFLCRSHVMKIIIKVIALLMSCSYALFAQCSDAGVCVIGSKRTMPGHQLGASYVFGKSGKTDDLIIHSIQIEGGIQFFPHSRLVVLLPWSRINGPLGYASGLGDITVLWNQGVCEMLGNQLSVQIGAKFATGDANSSNLPQAYQPGLGTNDLLLGISYETEPWLFALGYQLSRGRSDNAATRLRRGDDLFTRIGYKTHVDDLIVGLEILAIKRLQKSSVLDPAVAGGSSFIDVSGSDQFQANLLLTLSLPLSESFSLRSHIAVPLRSRRVNVDGLTRSVTLSVGVQCSL